jgi:hypothetical protein
MPQSPSWSQAGGHAHGFEVLQVPGPAERRELDLGPPMSDGVERHAHRPRGLLDGVAAAAQFRAHPVVALVDPGGVAVDARGAVGRRHRVDGRHPLGRAEIAVEQRVVVHPALGVVREDRGRDAVQALQRRAGGAAGVLLP